MRPEDFEQLRRLGPDPQTMKAFQEMAKRARQEFAPAQAQLDQIARQFAPVRAQLDEIVRQFAPVRAQLDLLASEMQGLAEPMAEWQRQTNEAMAQQFAKLDKTQAWGEVLRRVDAVEEVANQVTAEPEPHGNQTVDPHDDAIGIVYFVRLLPPEYRANKALLIANVTQTLGALLVTLYSDELIELSEALLALANALAAYAQSCG